MLNKQMSRTFFNRSFGFWFLIAASVMLLNPSVTEAGIRYWTRPASSGPGDWSTASNWGGNEPTISDSAYIVNGGTATITQSGETCNYLHLGDSGPGESGHVQMTGGSFTASNSFVGYDGVGSFSQSGGTHTIDTFEVGWLPGSSGNYNLNGGQLNTHFAEIGVCGTGIFTQSGGIHTVSLWLYFGSLSGSSGTYNLNGGTLVLGDSTFVEAGSGTAAFNFGGGTLQGSDFWSNIPMTLTGIGGNANINIPSETDSVSLDALSGPGGLNKIGAGMLCLSAANNYNGPTTISNGLLSLGSSGSIDATPVIDVQEGAYFSVSAKTGGFFLGSEQTLKGGGGVLGSVVAVSGSCIEPGDGLGSLYISDLTLNSGALLNFDLGTTWSSDYIYVNHDNTLTLDGQQFSDFTFTTLSGFGPGTYTLINAGEIVGSLGSELSGTVGGLPATLAVSGNDLVLNVVPEPGTWALLLTGCLALWVYAKRR